MLAVEEGLVEVLHTVEHGFVGIFLCGRQILRVAEELVGIKQALVHAAMLTVEETLEVAVAYLGYQIDAPVGHLMKQFLGHVAVAVEVGITQAGQNLVLHIEGHPAPVALDAGEVALVEFLP